MWTYTGQTRPAFAETPGPGQESVWDYPRPPKLAPSGRLVEVFAGNARLAKSTRALRVLETASPPTVYIPPSDVARALLTNAPGRSLCEWKGMAAYWALADDPEAGTVGWSYPDPRPPFTPLRDFITFYPAAVACFLDGERVHPQPGRFYGGWVTAEIVGPFKGEPGSGHW